MMRYDEWELFLEQRDEEAGWHWPLNLAVVLHLVMFGSAIMLQNMADHRPSLNLDNIVTVDLISMADPGPPPPAETVAAKPAAPVPEADEATGQIATLRPRPMVKKAVAPLSATESEPEPPAAAHKTAEKIAVASTSPPAPKQAAAQVKVIKPAQGIKKAVKTVAVQAQTQAGPKEAVSLNPVKKKTTPPVTTRNQRKEEAQIAEAEKKEAQAAEAEKVRKAEELRIAEAEKKEAEEKRAAAEKARKIEEARIAEIKRKEAQIKAAKLAEEKRVAAERARKVAEVRQKLAAEHRRKALAEAARVQQEAEQAWLAAEQAREELAHALQKNAAVRSAVTAVRSNGMTAAAGDAAGSGASPLELKRYAASLNDKISSSWKLPEMAANRNLKTVIALKVSRTGTIEDIQIEKKSGDALFDQSVLKALRSAEPLPDFPALVREPTLEFELNFTPNGLT